MVQIDLITGFLGSGKTTFLLKYARYLMNRGMKIGILEYDYGAVNIDMLLLQSLRGPQCELEMLSAACDADCHKRRFRTKLISMAMSGYDRIIVEPSGVFDTDEFFDTMRESPLDKWCDIGNVITVVNARLEDEMSPEADFLLASQCAGSGCILLSRTQEASPEQIENTRKHLKRACEAIRCEKNTDRIILAKNWDDLTDEDFNRLFKCSYSIYDYVKLTAGSETEFNSVYFLDAEFSPDVLQTKIKEMFSDRSYGKIFRIKGFAVKDGQWYQVNATAYETTVSELEVGKPVAIVIGTGLNEEKIRNFMMN